MRSTFQQIQDGLRAHLNSVSQSKTAAGVEQMIDGEKSVPSVPSSPEVKDIVPSISVPPEPKKNLVTERGNETGQTSDGTNLNPPKEEKERKEVKVASGSDLPPLSDLDKVQSSLAENLKLAAGIFGTKEAASSLGSKETVWNKSLGNEAKADTSGATPKIEGAEGVTQTDPKPNWKESTQPEQGTDLTSPESKVAADGGINIEELSKKMASFAEDVQHGKQMARDVIEMIKLANSQEYREFHQKADTLKIAAAADAISSLTAQAAEQGLITPHQADQLMKFAGFEENPIHVAIRDLQYKIALLKESGMDENQKKAFVKKANDPSAEVEGMPESAPVSPDELRGSVENLIAQLDAAVQSGQITEEQAIQVLQEQGVPISGAEGGAPAGAGGEMDEDQIEQLQVAFMQMLEELQAAVESGQITEEQAIEALRQQGIPIDEIVAAAMQEQQGGGAVEPTISADPSMGSAPSAPEAPSPVAAPEAPSPDDRPKTAKMPDRKTVPATGVVDQPPAITPEIKNPGTDLPPISLNPKVDRGHVVPVSSAPTPSVPEIKGRYVKGPPAIVVPEGGLPPEVEAAIAQAEASGATPVLADTTLKGSPEFAKAELAKDNAAAKNSDFWRYALATGGLGLIGLGAHSLISKDDDEEEKKRKKARLEEPEAKEKINKLATYLADYFAKKANAASLDTLLAELENAVAGGLISQEQAQAIVQVLAAQPAAAAPMA